jgi:hypothetical protein
MMMLRFLRILPLLILIAVICIGCGGVETGKGKVPGPSKDKLSGKDG